MEHKWLKDYTCAVCMHVDEGACCKIPVHPAQDFVFEFTKSDGVTICPTLDAGKLDDEENGSLWVTFLEGGVIYVYYRYKSKLERSIDKMLRLSHQSNSKVE